MLKETYICTCKTSFKYKSTKWNTTQSKNGWKGFTVCGAVLLQSVFLFMKSGLVGLARVSDLDHHRTIEYVFPQNVKQSLKPHKRNPSIVFGPSDLTNRYPWIQPSPDYIPVTFATAASHPLPLYDEAHDSNTYAVGVGGDAVTQRGRWHGDS